MARKIELGKLKLSWHARNGQWRKSIGYKPDKAGVRRVPAEFYFGAEEGSALLGAQQKLEEWKELVETWETEGRDGAVQVYPEMPLEEPFWWVSEAVLEAAAAVEEVAASRPENVTVAKAKEQYLEAMRGRLGMMGAKGLKQSTHNTIAFNLRYATRGGGSQDRRPGASGREVHPHSHARRHRGRDQPPLQKGRRGGADGAELLPRVPGVFGLDG
jgi:hypothetical protein